MSAGEFPSRRLRMLLDALLVLILLLLIAGRNPGAQNTVAQAQAVYSQPAPAGALPAPDNLPALDNHTLAAMIAAENAALTLPQYLLELPLLTK
jgi:hypothetical protein